MAKVQKSKDDSIDEEAFFVHESEYHYPNRIRYYWHRPQVSALLKKKIVELTNQDVVEIDAEFRKILLRTIQYFEDKKNKGGRFIFA